MDAAETNLLFDRCFDGWLGRRLCGPARPGDPVVVLSRENPRKVVETLRQLAQFRRRHGTAQTLPGDLDAQADREFTESVDAFRRWIARVQAEPKTQEYLEQLSKLAVFYAGAFEPSPDFPRLWRLAHPPWIEGLMRKDTYDFVQYRRLTQLPQFRFEQHVFSMA